ncbi:MAG: hypothetical protein LPK92_02075 [Actinomycetes bacterium]|nr:hypothetical protein [Actinomycetes bacterium]
MKRATFVILALGAALTVTTVVLIAPAAFTPGLVATVLLFLVPYGVLWLARARVHRGRGQDGILLAGAILVLVAGGISSFLLLATNGDGEASAWAALFAVILAVGSTVVALVGGVAASVVAYRSSRAAGSP